VIWLYCESFGLECRPLLTLSSSARRRPTSQGLAVCVLAVFVLPISEQCRTTPGVNRSQLKSSVQHFWILGRAPNGAWTLLGRSYPFSVSRFAGTHGVGAQLDTHYCFYFVTSQRAIFGRIPSFPAWKRSCSERSYHLFSGDVIFP